MADSTLPDYEQFDFFLHQNELPCSAAEIHGIICGCLCGGMQYKQGEWLKLISEFALQNAEIPDEALTKFRELYQISYQQLIDTNFGFQIFLPTEDDLPLAEMAQILLEWLSAFIASFGAVVGEQFADADDEVREAYQDLIQISQMDTEMDESEGNQLAFEEVAEYIRMTTVLCFGELGDRSATDGLKKPTIH